MRIFYVDGIKKEFNDDTSCYSPDTCNCIIVYDKNMKYVDVFQTCKTHESLTKQTLLNKIQSDNREENLKYGNEPTEEQKNIIRNSKEKLKKASGITKTKKII